MIFIKNRLQNLYFQISPFCLHKKKFTLYFANIMKYRFKCLVFFEKFATTFKINRKSLKNHKMTMEVKISIGISLKVLIWIIIVFNFVFSNLNCIFLIKQANYQ